MKILSHFAASARPDARIAQLDGWRGISILFVLIGHLVPLRYGVPSDSSFGRLAIALAPWGVNIFFVISGFIITKLALRKYKQEGLFSIRNFYIRRLFRIIPPYFLYLLTITVAAGAFAVPQPLSGVLRAAAFACNLPAADCGWAVSHTWTLAFEEQFYIAFPLLFSWIYPKARSAFFILFLLLLGIPFFRFFLHLEGGWRAVAEFVPSFSFICIGASAASFEDEIALLARSRAAKYLSGAALLSLFAILVLNTLFAFPLSSLGARIQLSLNAIILPFGFAWLVVSSVHQSNYLTRALSLSPLVFVGTISYSLYLWQQVFMAAPPAYHAPGSPFLLWPLVFVIASASYYFVERPAVQLGRRLEFLARPPTAIDNSLRKIVER